LDVGVELAGEVPLQTPHDLGVAEALAAAALYVVAGALVPLPSGTTSMVVIIDAASVKRSLPS
jgi:hypothetical protein